MAKKREQPTTTNNERKKNGELTKLSMRSLFSSGSLVDALAGRGTPRAATPCLLGVAQETPKRDRGACTPPNRNYFDFFLLRKQKRRRQQICLSSFSFWVAVAPEEKKIFCSRATRAGRQDKVAMPRVLLFFLAARPMQHKWTLGHWCARKGDFYVFSLFFSSATNKREKTNRKARGRRGRGKKQSAVRALATSPGPRGR